MDRGRIYFDGLGLALVFAAMIFAATTAACATWRGAGLGGDSVDYVATSRNILAGRGVLTLDGQGGVTPLTQFPPLYPILLAIAAKLSGQDPVVAARWVGIISNVLLIALIGLAARRASNGSMLAAGIAALLAAASVDLLYIGTNLLSESPFICLLLMMFLALNNRISGMHSRRWIVLGGIAAALASLTRFAGSFFIGVALVSLIFLSKTTWRNRIIDAMIFLSLAIAPSIAWNWRNVHVTGRPTPRRFVFHPIAPAKLWIGVKVMVAWLLPSAMPAQGVCLAILMVILAALVWYAMRRRDSSRGWIITLAMIALLYPIFLIACSSFVDANVRLDHRLLSPMLPVIVLLLVATVGAALSDAHIAWRWVTVCVCVSAIVYNGYRTISQAIEWMHRGQGYAAKMWDQSETLKAVCRAPESCLIYTNGYDLIYLRTGRMVRQLPKSNLISQATANPSLDHDIKAMADRLRDRGGWVVYLNRIRRSNALIDERDLCERLSLHRLHKHEPADGSIYHLDDDASAINPNDSSYLATAPRANPVPP